MTIKKVKIKIVFIIVCIMKNVIKENQNILEKIKIQIMKIKLIKAKNRKIYLIMKM